MDKKRWEQEYPKMPESFHLAVQDAVERQGNRGDRENDEDAYKTELCREEAQKETAVTRRMGKRRRKRAKRFYLFAAAAVLLCGALSAVAGVIGKKVDFREELKLENRENIGAAFQSKLSVKVEEEPRLPEQAYTDEEYREWLTSWERRENNLPLLDIREAMFDGMRLSVFAVPTEEGKKYSLEVVNLYINGVEKGPVDCFDNMGEQDYYIFTLDDVNSFNLDDADNTRTQDTKLREKPLRTPFEVTLSVRVYASNKRYENQDMTFTVDTDAELKKLADQKFVFTDYTVKVTELQRSLTSLKGKVSVEMTEEQREAYEKGERELCDLLLKNRDGTVWGNGLGISEEERLQSHGNAGNYQWYFHEQIPENAGDTVMLYLMACEKASEGEKLDVRNMGNVFGEGMELRLE